MFYLRLSLAVLGFVAASLYGVLIAVFRRDRRLVAHDYARMLARCVQPALGVRVRTLAAENLEARRPCIYIANHQSLYDVPVLGELYPPDTVVIGKKELTQIPLFGWIFTATGNVLIDRKDSPSAVGRLREAQEAILVRGVSVWIFPEGTRGATPGELLPFKKGAFHMAVAAAVPLVPIVCAPISPLFSIPERRIRPGMLEVRVLEPIATEGLGEDDVPRLMEQARERMQEALRELRAVPDER